VTDTPTWAMSGARRAALTAASVLATTLMAVDITIASVALSQIQGSLAVTPDQVAWVLTAYMIALAIATPAVGAVSDRLGRRRTFLFAVAGFTLCSVACGLAWSIESLVAFRFAKGAFAAALVPISQAVLLDAHPPERHGRAMAYWSIGVMVGPIVGPLAGGWLVQNFDWRWIFLVNVPFGALAYAAIVAFLPRDGAVTARRFDTFGYVALALSLACLQFVLERGERADWFEATHIVVLSGLALAAGWVFVAHSKTSREPFFDPALFRDTHFVACVVVTFVTSGVFYANLSMFAPFLQGVLGYPADAAGYMIAPRGFGVLLGVAASSALRRFASDRVIISAGLVGSAIGIGSMTSFSLETDPWLLTWTGVVQGVCYGVMFAPLTTATFATLPARLRTEAAALVQLVRQISGGIGIAFAFTLLTREGHGRAQALVETVDPDVGASVLGASDLGVAQLQAELARQAGLLAYLHVVGWLVLAILLMLPFVAMIRPLRERSPAVATTPD
jgi:DHA2 family multidrug resistance protein